MKSKGMTLIEVIVAIAILGILAVSLFAVLTNNMTLLIGGDKITDDIYAAKQVIERNIVEVKQKIMEGTYSDYQTIVRPFGFPFNIEVAGVKGYVGKQYFFTLIGNNHIPPPDMPIVESVITKLKYQGREQVYSYAWPDAYIEGTVNIVPSTLPYWLTNISEWYVSREGFNIPLPNSDPEETEVGVIYPAFPKDYRLLSASGNLNVNDITDYGGKHLVLSVKPAAKTGHIGDRALSKPIFISGLPISVAKSYLHLDASLINIDAPSEVATNFGSTQVVKWNDISGNSWELTPWSLTKRPALIKSPAFKFISRLVHFEQNQRLRCFVNGIRRKKIHVFAVVMGENEGVIGKMGRVNLVYDQENAEAINDQLYLVDWTFKPFNNWLSLTAYNKNDANSKYSLAEFIIYQDTPEDEEIKTIKAYLMHKYRALPPNGSVDSLYDSVKTKKITDPFVMPASVLAKMADGNDSYVPVEWENTLDTNKLGRFTARGHLLNDSEKKVTLTLNVVR